MAVTTTPHETGDTTTHIHMMLQWSTENLLRLGTPSEVSLHQSADQTPVAEKANDWVLIMRVGHGARMITQRRAEFYFSTGGQAYVSKFSRHLRASIWRSYMRRC